MAAGIATASLCSGFVASANRARSRPGSRTALVVGLRQ